MKKYVKKIITIFCSIVLILLISDSISAETQSNNWVWPTYIHTIQNDWPNYSSGSYHAGTDFPVPLNTEVHSTCDGVVVSVQYLTTSYGKHIKIKANVNGQVVYMRYCHLNEILVSEGQYVTAGQVIGKSGSTGNSTGPHLHYEVRNSVDSYDNALNPKLYLPGTSYTFETTKPANNPFGYVESVTADMGKITIRGWAADMDNPNESIDVHIYTVQDGVREGIALKADKYRADMHSINSNINEYHGFEATINTGLSGDVQIEVYGINIGEGVNAMLDDSPKTVFVPKDTINPTVSDIKIIDYSTSSYTITCKVEDNVGISRISIATWTEQNGQDDIIWSNETFTGNTLSYKVNIADHNNEKNCIYSTHIYAYDFAGNSIGYPVTVYFDAEPPTISDVEVSDVSSAGYTVTCKIEDNAQISKIEVATWTGQNGQDDIVWSEETLTENILRYKVYTRDHNDEKDCIYYTHIYAYDLFGNKLGYSVDVEVDSTTLPSIYLGDLDHDGRITTVDLSTVNQAVNGLATLSDDDRKRADVNGDGAITKEDVELIQKYIAGLITEFPAENMLMEIIITKAPDKVTYSVGERVSTVGMQVMAVYGNSKGKEITDYEVSGDTSKVGNSEIVVAYMENGIIKSASQKISVIEEHVHDYKEIVIKEATCARYGSMLYKCSCGDSYSKVIPKTDHLNKEIRDYKLATCETDGYMGDTYCKDCGEKLQSGAVIEKLSHDYADSTFEWSDDGKSAKVVYVCKNDKTHIVKYDAEITSKVKEAATCHTKGTTTYTATYGKGVAKVSDSKDVQDIAINKNNHVGSTEVRNVRKASCEQEGYTGDIYCGSCGTKISTGRVVQKTNHQWDAGRVIQNASCTNKGTKVYTCTECETTKNEDIPVTGHQTTIVKFAKAASCKAEGYTGDTHCQDCGELLEEGKVIPEKEHSWNVGEVIQSVTCTEDGKKQFTCSSCGTIKLDIIPATGHEETEVRNKKDATCGEEGYTGDTYCISCRTKISMGRVVEKTNHQWDAGKVTQNASCMNQGIRVYICTKCEQTRNEDIPAIGHKATIVKFAKETSCKIEGYTGDTYCQDCGELLEEGTVIPKKEHIWNEGEVIQATTCTEDGKKQFTCSSCGATKLDTLPATGHGETEVRNIRKATYKTSGYTGDSYCKDCGKKIASGKTIAKLKAKSQTISIASKYKKTVTQKVATLKKKKIEYKLNAKAKGTLTYKVTRGSSKYITVSKKGVVTLKKGCKKGTYQVMITTEATKTGEYKKATKVVTFKVK